ncbi:hypothetical protein [Yimella lutea]|uniref:hypothetical protein n=1 Tax=Yimella lutea TaxID=587872 RepID=UPI0014778876|nr:hypothetical protein [Yimella lutea]
MHLSRRQFAALVTAGAGASTIGSVSAASAAGRTRPPRLIGLTTSAVRPHTRAHG